MRDILYDVFYRLDVSTASEDSVVYELFASKFNHISVSRMRTSSIMTKRNAADSKEDPCEYFNFVFPKAGAIHFDRGKKEGAIHTWQPSLFHSAETRRFSYSEDFVGVMLTMPCDILRERVRGIDDLCSRPDIANPMLIPVVAKFAGQLLMFDGGESEARLEDALLDLVCLMIETRGAAPSELPMRRALVDVTYERILTYMRGHFRDPNLTPAKVAEGHRMSLRTLHHIFHMHGSTFGQTLLEIRLTEAHHLLSMLVERDKRPAIGEIAYRCGFVNQAHFSARFREHFGVTPRSVVAAGSS